MFRSKSSLYLEVQGTLAD